MSKTYRDDGIFTQSKLTQ